MEARHTICDLPFMFIRRNVQHPSLCCLAFVIAWLSTGSLNAQSGQTIYTDSLQNGWLDWSWATVNLGNASPARSGTSISVSAGGWEALYLHHASQSGSGFSNLTAASADNWCVFTPRAMASSKPGLIWIRCRRIPGARNLSRSLHWTWGTLQTSMGSGFKRSAKTALRRSTWMTSR